jgi:Do/DeqQ family serine protease
MKQFGSLVLAAILGSTITYLTIQWTGVSPSNVKIEHIDGAPIHNVGYTVNEKGEMVPLDFTGTAEKVTKAVVHIRSTSSGTVAQRDPRDRSTDPWQFFFGPQGPVEQGPSIGTGSGVIINADGYIVTNNHVVQDADMVDVTLSDNRTLKAEVIGTDPDTDLAVIKINEKNLTYLSFINSDNAKVGEWVLAVGNPFNLNSTVTAGIISAKGRNLSIIGNNRSPQIGPNGQPLGSTAIESFIQTDAAINPGNSGGALVNLSGGLLGINTAIASQTGTYMGYGFAVPANLVSKIVEDLLAYGTVQRGWLGIQVSGVTSEVAKRQGLSVNEGALVGSFGDFEDKSAAKAAGIMVGDVIVKLDETVIKSNTALIEYIGMKRPGDKVVVTVNRGGKEKIFNVTLKNRDGNVGTVKREEKDAVTALGIDLEDIDPKLLKGLDLTNGVKVKALGNGKIGRYTDMEEGFIITRVDDTAVKTAKEVNDILKKKKPGDLITFSGVYENYSREYIYALRM